MQEELNEQIVRYGADDSQVMVGAELARDPKKDRMEEEWIYWGNCILNICCNK